MLSSPQKVGHGASGCIYRPAIPCKNGKTPEGYIAKLIQKKNLRKEYNEELIRKLEDIDPDQLFVIRPIKPEDVCEGNDKDANIQNALLQTCTPFTEQVFRGEAPVQKNDTTVVYQIDAGSKTLGDLVKEDYGPIKKTIYEPSSTVVNALQKTLDIETFLLDHGLTHADISLGNVMVLDDGSLRFIDTAGITPVGNKHDALESFFDNLQKSQISVRFSNRTNLQTMVAPFRTGLPIRPAMNEPVLSQASTLTISPYRNNNNSGIALHISNNNNNNNNEFTGIRLLGGTRKRFKKRKMQKKKRTKKQFSK